MDLKRLNDDDMPNHDDLMQKSQLYMQEREGDRLGYDQQNMMISAQSPQYENSQYLS